MKLSNRTALFSLIVIVASSVFGCASQQNAETKPHNNGAATQQAATTQPNPAAPQNPGAEQKAATQQTAPSKEPELEISLPENAASAAIGSTVNIPIAVSSKSNKELFSYSFAVMFDPAVLQPTNNPTSINGTLSDGFLIASDTKTAGRLGIAAASSGKTINANGTLLNIHFKVIGKSTEKMNIKIAQPIFQDISGTQINVIATVKQ